MKKSCKKGYYYCFTSKKCKKIPAGHHVMGSGRLMKDSEHEEKEGGEESTETTKNGNGNGNGGNGNGGAVSEGWSDKYKKSINCDNPKGFSQRAHCQGRKVNEAKEKDHEVSMAKTQVKKSIDNLQKVARVLAKKTDADNLPAWVQSKLSDTEHNTDAAASYMTGGDDDVSEQIDASKYTKLVNGKKVPLNPHELLQRMVPNPVVIPKSQIKLTQSFEPEGKLLDEKKKGGTLHKWFEGSKSKDGKPGWVNVVTGGTCASDEPGEGTPKCVSSSKRASMTKAERKSAARRKKKADPGQQQKSGAAKPTYVSTDPKKKKKVEEEFEVTEARDVKGKGSGKKDACYYKVKSRYSVWPSAYASGALVKCRKVGAKNWGNKTKKESYEYSNWRDDFVPTDYETVDLITADPIQVPDSNIQKIEEAKKCWKGYEKKGTQKLFGKTYNRCVKKEELSNWRAELNLQEDWQKVNKKDKTDGMSQKAVDAYKRENPGSKLKTAVTEKKPKGKRAKRRKSFCARSDGQRKMHNIDCKKTPDKAICKARRRWRC